MMPRPRDELTFFFSALAICCSLSSCERPFSSLLAALVVGGGRWTERVGGGAGSNALRKAKRKIPRYNDQSEIILHDMHALFNLAKPISSCYLLLTNRGV
jgi:hypothetical protein